MGDELDEIAGSKLRRKELKGVGGKKPYVGTGSTLLNVALSGRAFGGIGAGEYLLLVGDSSACKTWLGLNILAEAANNQRFSEHELVYDPTENGALMDIRRFFGGRLADRMLTQRSRTAEEFYYNLDDRLKKGPCVVVLDSMDGLDAEDDVETFEESKKAFRKGKEAGGTYGTAKAKINSTTLRLMVSQLERTGSVLVIISQTREKIGNTVAWGDNRTRGGGKALKFYAHLEVWTKVLDTIKSGKVRGKERAVGRNIQLKVTKNRQTGWEGTVEFPFYRSFGIDDTGSCVDFLVDEQEWKKKQGVGIDAGEFGRGSREELIRKIELDGRVGDVRRLVASVWNSIEVATEVYRKPRYK